MTTQPSTYPRRSRRQARIEGREGVQRTSGTLWRKLERGRKRWNWDLKTVSLRHCRSLGSHKTPSASVGQPFGRPFVPSLSEGCGTVRVAGRGRCRMSKERERAPLATPEPFLQFLAFLISLTVFLSLSCDRFFLLLDLFFPSGGPSRCV